LGPAYLVGRRAYRAYVLLNAIGGSLFFVVGGVGTFIYPIHSPTFAAFLAAAFVVLVWGRHRIASSGRAVDELPVGHTYKTINFRRWPSTNFWLFEISTLSLVSLLLYIFFAMQRQEAINAWVWLIPIVLAAAMAFGIWKQAALSQAQDRVEPSLFFWLAQISLWLVLALELLALWALVTRRREGIGPLPTMLTVATAYSIFYSIAQRLRRRRRS
jgi:uncharacterized membrane protein